MPKEMLTPHFSLEEMTKSDTAMKWGIPNTPTPMERQNLKTLCLLILEPLRAAAGRPLKINSGFRSTALNKKVGGADNSYHLTGRAADISVNNYKEASVLACKAKELPLLDLAIIESKGKSVWLHVQFSPTHARHKVLEIIKP